MQHSAIKISFALCIIILLTSLALAYSSPVASSNMSDYDDVFFGPGIIQGCKHVQLYRVIDREKESPVSVDYQADNFAETRKWLFENVYEILNRPRQNSGQKSEYCIALSTLQNHDMGDILLIVPLNKETLGPDYTERIAQLRAIMMKNSGK